MSSNSILFTIILWVKDSLSHHPYIGMASGFGSGLFLIITSFFTDESVIKVIGICGVWLGFIIAVLTLFIKLFEIMRWSVGFFKKGKK